MAVNALKIRLGAPDSMVLFAGTSNQLDLGASAGGAVLVYNPTNFQVEIDQNTLPVAAYKVKEEITFSVGCVQSQANLFLAAFSYASSGVVTVASGTLAAATGVTATPQGTAASTTYTYQVVAVNYNGDAVPSSNATTATGNATLSATNYNLVSWTAVTGAISYKIIRTAGGATQGQIGQTLSGLVTTFNDTGLAATAYVSASTAPALPNQDTALFGNTQYVVTGTFDWAVPKWDGTTNHWLGHMNKAFSAKQISVNYNKEKHTDVAKVELAALADLTQPVGQQAGWLREQY